MLTYLIKLLKALGAKNVVLTGVSFEKGKLGCACYDGNKIEYTFTNRLDASVHGTGDVFASAFVGSMISEVAASRTHEIVPFLPSMSASIWSVIVQ